MWRIWCYALGKKEGRDDKDADKIAFVRTIIMVQLVITNMFIIFGNIKYLWFDNLPKCIIHNQNVTLPEVSTTP